METSALKIENIRFESSYQNQPVAGYIFTNPMIVPFAILQISHGMAEYIMRYAPFAEFLTRHGFIVCGHDHLGHGDTSGVFSRNGFFAPENGQDYVLEDLLQMNQLIRARYPELPLVLFGHSMGSFFARWFIEKYPHAANAAVICGTGGSNPLGNVGIVITAIISKLYGATHCSEFVNNLAFGTYNKRVADCKTEYDWLSANERNVQDYVADPKCGFSFTVSAWNAVMKVLQHVNSNKCFKNTPVDIPFFIIAGTEDPVGAYGKGPIEVAQRLEHAGVKKVQVSLYDGMRHEILNENDSLRVQMDVLIWIRHALEIA